MLTGSVPSGLGNLSSLRVLWLEFNNLSGSLPQDLSKSSSLLSIDVRGNPRLCGTIPAGLHVNAVPSQWQGFCAKAYTEDSGKAQPLAQSIFCSHHPPRLLGAHIRHGVGQAVRCVRACAAGQV